MSLPEQLQKQVQAAEDIIAQHYGTGEEAASGVPGGNPPSETGSGAPAATAESGGVTTHSTTPEVTPAEDDNSPTMGQRWRSLQGVYNAEVRKSQMLESRVNQLEQLISTMSATPPAQQAEVPVTRFLTERDTETYGDDMIDFTRRATAEAVTAAVAPLQQYIASLEQRLAHVQQVVPTVQQVARQQELTRQEKFEADLSMYVPDWEAINVDPRFHAWLADADPLTNITRQTYLNDAHRGLDLSRVVNIFRSWKELSGNAAPPATTQQPAASSARAELERQIAPGRNTAAVVPTSASDAPRYTPHDISAFYDEVRRGAWKGREAERDAKERDIFLAQREGRIAQRAA